MTVTFPHQNFFFQPLQKTSRLSLERFFLCVPFKMFESTAHSTYTFIYVLQGNIRKSILSQMLPATGCQEQKDQPHAIAFSWCLGCAGMCTARMDQVGKFLKRYKALSFPQEVTSGGTSSKKRNLGLNCPWMGRGGRRKAEWGKH